MKLFVIIVFASVSIVFADDVAWQSGPSLPLVPYVYVKESVPLPVYGVAGQTHEEVKTQNSQGNAGNSLPFREPLRPDPREEQSDALNYQSVEQLKVARKANEIATRDNGIQGSLVTVGWITIVTMALLTIAQLYFVWTANQHAAVAALAAKESVEIANRSMKIANRAYLSLGRWEFGGLKDNARLRVRFFLVNSGNTPATIVAQCGDCEVSEGPPPRPDYADLLKRERISLPISGKGELLQIVNTAPIETARVDELRSGKALFYCYGCIVYYDVFKEQQSIEYLIVYDPRSRGFYLEGGHERNRST